MDFPKHVAGLAPYLTDLEQSVIVYRDAGYSQREIAEYLGLSRYKVSRILAQIREKYTRFQAKSKKDA